MLLLRPLANFSVNNSNNNNDNKGIELPNQEQEKIRSQRKRNLQVLYNIRNGHHQTSGGERKK